MISNAQKRLQTARLEEKLTRLALRAIMADPRAKLWAEVNNSDNFALAMMVTANDAIFDSFSGNMTNIEVEWVNMACEKQSHKSYLNAFCVGICLQAYDTLRKPLTAGGQSDMVRA